MFKRTISLAVCTLLLLAGMSIAADTESGIVKLKAKVMAVDLADDLAIIAEQEFKLLSHYDEEGEKVWDTLFLDKDGNPIAPDQIEQRDRVVVHGENDAGTLIAREIMLLE